MRKRQVIDKENAGRLMVPATLPFDYELVPANGQPDELIILLHGFAESGSRILGKLAPAIPANALVLAPNAPFPMPHKTEQGYVMTHAWYFYDPMRKEYFIDMQPALKFLAEGVRALGLGALPTRIIGFSQGGYLAPFAAQHLTGVRQVIGLACEYLSDELVGDVPFRIDGVHGTADAVISPEEAQQTHALLSARGIKGGFQLLEGATHRIDDRMREEVKKALSL